MKRLLLGLLVTANILNAYTSEYHMTMQFERGLSLETIYNKVIINGKEMLCHFCGKGPMMVIFFYGCPTAYCFKHLPKIEMPEDDELDKLAKGLYAKE